MAAKTVILRRCIGSTRFGIEPHDALSEEFPKQPSQKDGLGRMCKVHWNAYTAGLARDANARRAADAIGAAPEGTAAVDPLPDLAPGPEAAQAGGSVSVAPGDAGQS